MVFKFAIFYAGKNQDHYCRLIDNKGTIKGVAFGELSGSVTELSSSNKGTLTDDIYLHYENG